MLFYKNMNIRLQNSIENLYRVFALYPLKSRIEGCPCCVKNKDNSVLHSKNLRDLTGEDLSYFGFKAMTTFGDVEDFKHFLPRLFEIMVEKDLAYNEEILFGKLDYGKWQTWAKTEREAVENFFIELVREITNSESEENYLVETCFVGIAIAVEEIAPYFNLWFEDLNNQKIKNFAYFVTENNCGLDNAFLQKDLTKRLQIKEWLSSLMTVELFEDLFFNEKFPNSKDDLAKSLDFIYKLKKEENLQ